MRKASIVPVVVLGAVILVFVLAPTVQWDGVVTREVMVIVEGNDGSPIPRASVAFKDPRYVAAMDDTNAIAHMTTEELQAWKGLHRASGVTDASGVFTFATQLPAGGRQVLFWDRGHFGLIGTVTVAAEGHRPLESPLSELAGCERMPVSKHRKSPIVVHCMLDAADIRDQDAEDL